MSNQKTMNLQEYKLYQPVKTWLIENDYEVFAEVQKPYGARTIDVVGKREDEIIIIELKMFATKTVLHQCSRSQHDTDKVYAAVGAQPLAKTIEKFKKYGIGILLVKNDQVSEILSPSKKWDINEASRQTLISKLYKKPDDFVAGLPCMAGTGPAQDCERRISLYKKDNPKASWKEIFAAVPNHYASASSMQSAMHKTRERKEIKERKAAKL